MTEHQTTGRRVSRQREAGEVTRKETRRRLLLAARDEFAENGYRAATVARIAARADVAVQTLYHAWGSKRDLLRGVLELAITGGDEVHLDRDELPHALLAAADLTGQPDPEALLAYLAREFRTLAERSAGVWKTYRDAAAVDPDIAADWSALMELRRANFATLFRSVPTTAWRKGLSAEQAVDTVWTIASPQTHELLVGVLGYSYDDYETWVLDTTRRAALDAT
jgi:AcrR family transcriptional regulator